MKKSIWIVIVLVVIIIIASFAGSEKREPQSIKIGVIDVLSGQYSSLGENYQKGIELAKDEYLKAHPDAKIELVYEDDAFEAQKGLSAYNKLMSVDKVDALIIATSPTINTIYPEVSKLPLPIITYGSQSIEEQDDNVFHLYPSSGVVVESIGKYLASTTAGTNKKVISVYTNDATIAKFFNDFKKGFGTTTEEFQLGADSKDVRTQATKAFATKPSFVFMSNFAQSGAQFLKELIRLSGGSLQMKDITPALDLTFTEATSEYEKVLGDLKVLDGSIVVALKQADQDGFNAKYVAKYNNKPGQLADYGYDTFNLMVSAYDPDSTKWITNISGVKMLGATGEISFDGVGRRLPVFRITTLKDGKVPAY